MPVPRASRISMLGLRHLALAGVMAATLVMGATASRAQTEETGGIGGTGISGQETGGIGGTGVRPAPVAGYGPIQRFGSVFVNGREYQFDAHTLVTVDGKPAPIAALRIGDMALIHGIAIGRTGGVAHDIAVWQSIVGPVASVSPDSKSFTVLGQQVLLTDPTAAVRPGEIVGVSGQRQADGTWVATRVITLPHTARFRLETTVTAIKPDRVSFQGLTLRAAPALLNGIHAGDRVLATGMITDGAMRLTTLTPRPLELGSPGTHIEARGYFHSAGSGRLVSPDGMVVVGARTATLSGLHPAEIVGQLDADGDIHVHEVRTSLPTPPTDEVVREESHPAIERPGGDRRTAGEAEVPIGHSSEAATSDHIEPPEVNEPQEMNEPDIEPPEIQVPEPQSPEPDIDAPEVEPPNDK